MSSVSIPHQYVIEDSSIILSECEESLLRGRHRGWSSCEDDVCRRSNRAGYSTCWNHSAQWMVSSTAARL